MAVLSTDDHRICAGVDRGAEPEPSDRRPAVRRRRTAPHPRRPRQRSQGQPAAMGRPLHQGAATRRHAQGDPAGPPRPLGAAPGHPRRRAARARHRAARHRAGHRHCHRRGPGHVRHAQRAVRAATRADPGQHPRRPGRRPKLTAEQAALAQQLYDAGDKTVQQIADLFGVPRSTVYGYLNRVPAGTPV